MGIRSAGSVRHEGTPRWWRAAVVGLLVATACSPSGPEPAASAATTAPTAVASVPTAVATAPATAGSADRFSVALIGDYNYSPYGTGEWLESPALIASINGAGVRSVIHVGDTKAGSEECSDETADHAQEQFATFDPPLVYLFGDNEWTDCYRYALVDPTTRFGDPVERLADLRRRYWSTARSQGRNPIEVVRQSDVDPARALYVEHVRWTMGPVVFVGLDVPGSNNNGTEPEAGPRTEAAVAWIVDSFAEAQRTGAKGVVVSMQADPGFEELTAGAFAGYRPVIRALADATRNFAGQVVLVHGDFHLTKIDHPLFDADDPYTCNATSCGAQVIDRFTRVETVGTPDLSRWVRMTVDPTTPALFSFDYVAVGSG